MAERILLQQVLHLLQQQIVINARSRFLFNRLVLARWDSGLECERILGLVRMLDRLMLNILLLCKRTDSWSSGNGGLMALLLLLLVCRLRRMVALFVSWLALLCYMLISH